MRPHLNEPQPSDVTGVLGGAHQIRLYTFTHASPGVKGNAKRRHVRPAWRPRTPPRARRSAAERPPTVAPELGVELGLGLGLGVELGLDHTLLLLLLLARTALRVEGLHVNAKTSNWQLLGTNPCAHTSTEPQPSDVTDVLGGARQIQLYTRVPGCERKREEASRQTHMATAHAATRPTLSGGASSHAPRCGSKVCTLATAPSRPSPPG